MQKRRCGAAVLGGSDVRPAAAAASSGRAQRTHRSTAAQSRRAAASSRRTALCSAATDAAEQHSAAQAGSRSRGSGCAAHSSEAQRGARGGRARRPSAAAQPRPPRPCLAGPRDGAEPGGHVAKVGPNSAHVDNWRSPSEQAGRSRRGQRGRICCPGSKQKLICRNTQHSP